ncbi:hypothetical protein Pan216_02450 [Planctomycetes bacterium Pan216]|uniref:Uncharacterized protein n=1 Tax=Kolteria novifilia TaxID=2527975 RepID=A0A518AXG3_9BACT|nr:hypothetical protein Pan216_02450 [Planctomycetes bacterium Pan216]
MPETRNCPDCDAEVSIDATVCPKCQRALEPYAPKTAPMVPVYIAIIVVIFIAVVVYFNWLPTPPELE